MRTALLAGLVLATVPGVGFAQSGPYVAVVADPDVKLRAGPGDKYDVTATLKSGFPLIVDHEEEGWVAVQDVPGRVNSLSWVQTQFIDFREADPLPQLVTVDEAGTTLRAGQFGLNEPLAVQRTKVPGGTILTVIGKGVKFEGKTWYPVVPPAGDFRYLPKTAVKFEKPASTSFTVRDSVPGGVGGGAPTASLPNGGAAGVEPAGGNSPVKPVVQHPLWSQAEMAEKEGKYDEAEKLFFQLARVMNEPGGDHDIANLCYTRIHTLREKRRGGGNITPTSGSSGVSWSTTQGNATASRTPPGALGPPTGGGSGGTTGSDQRSSGTGFLPPEAPPASPPSPASGGNTGSKPPPRGTEAGTNASGKWTGPGRLVRSALALDGRRTYALESSPGITTMYVVAGPDIDLEKSVNKKVDVFGVSQKRRDLSRPFVVATTVELVP